MSEFLVVVAYNRVSEKYSDKKKYPMGDPERSTYFGRVVADMGMDPPVPELTSEEMQPVAFAAKMALLKVMQDRAFKRVKSAGRRKKPAKKAVPRRRARAEKLDKLLNEYQDRSNMQY